MELKTFINKDKILNRIDHYLTMNDDFDRFLYYMIFKDIQNLEALIQKNMKTQGLSFTQYSKDNINRKVEDLLSTSAWLQLGKMQIGKEWITED